MKEVDLYTSVVKKLAKKHPVYFENLINDFSSEFCFESKEEFEDAMKQQFYSWIFLDYFMLDGKKLIDFCVFTLDLTEAELIMLEKIKQSIRGLFIIKRNKDFIIELEDVITKQMYVVSTIDFNLQEGIIKANLTKNSSENLFLFGGVYVYNEETVEQYLIEEGLQ